MNVEFKFKPLQRVETDLSGEGIVEMCGIDRTELKTYYVRTSKKSTWFFEDQLKEK